MLEVTRSLAERKRLDNRSLIGEGSDPKQRRCRVRSREWAKREAHSLAPIHQEKTSRKRESSAPMQGAHRAIEEGELIRSTEFTGGNWRVERSRGENGRPVS